MIKYRVVIENLPDHQTAQALHDALRDYVHVNYERPMVRYEAYEDSE